MTPDEAIALSFATFSDLPRAGLTDRLHADDPHLWISHVSCCRALTPCAWPPRGVAFVQSHGTMRLSLRRF
jgi:hypothetical protein